jgi:V/A-type H+/Na+-transporting ATPase subunit F
MNGIDLHVIGDEDAVLGFALLGVHGEVVHTPAEAHHALHAAVAAGRRRIILVTAEWAAAMREEINSLQAASELYILEIPASRPQPQRTSLRALVQAALGVRLDH